MNKVLTMFVTSSLVASPALGSVRDAAFASSADRNVAQTSIFAGATYRVALDRRTAESRGRVSLAFTGMTRTPTADFKFGQGFQISAGPSGKPAFLVGGQDLGQMEKYKAKLNGGTTAVLVAVGVALLAGAIILVTHCDNDCDNAKNE